MILSVHNSSSPKRRYEVLDEDCPTLRYSVAITRFYDRYKSFTNNTMKEETQQLPQAYAEKLLYNLNEVLNNEMN